LVAKYDEIGGTLLAFEMMARSKMGAYPNFVAV
jgi:hypothetical protein